jgi:hypothetical protein
MNLQDSLKNIKLINIYTIKINSYNKIIKIKSIFIFFKHLKS